MLHWLPHGYATTRDDRLLGIFFDTDGKWDEKSIGDENLPELIRVVKKAIEDHLRDHPNDAAGHLDSKDW